MRKCKNPKCKNKVNNNVKSLINPSYCVECTKELSKAELLSSIQSGKYDD